MTALRQVLVDARNGSGGSLSDLTVLSVQIDPYRLDTPANHAVAKWFAEQMERLRLLERRLHLRGIHYAMLGSTTLPSGEPTPTPASAGTGCRIARRRRRGGWDTCPSVRSSTRATPRR